MKDFNELMKEVYNNYTLSEIIEYMIEISDRKYIEESFDEYIDSLDQKEIEEEELEEKELEEEALDMIALNRQYEHDKIGGL